MYYNWKYFINIAAKSGKDFGKRNFTKRHSVRIRASAPVCIPSWFEVREVEKICQNEPSV